MTQPTDFVRLKGGPTPANALAYLGSWPPPERLRVFHFGDALIGFADATLDVPNVLEAQESFYSRGSFSRLPDDHGFSHVARGAEYRFEA
jgi:hypothetical protein